MLLIREKRNGFYEKNKKRKKENKRKFHCTRNFINLKKVRFVLYITLFVFIFSKFFVLFMSGINFDEKVDKKKIKKENKITLVYNSLFVIDTYEVIIST